MKLNRTASNWTSLERNKINENWDIIEGLGGKVDNIVDEISDEAFNKIVDSAKLNWKEPVDTVGDLPSGANEGDTRMARDSGKVYRYNGSNWQEIQQIDAGPVNEVDRRLTEQLAQITTNVNNYKHLVIDDDWTLAIQEAIDYVHSRNGGEVLVPNGTFNYSSDIHLKEGVTLVGHGEGTLLQCTSLEKGRIIFYTDTQLKNLNIEVPYEYDDGVLYFNNIYVSHPERRNQRGNAKILVHRVNVYSDFNGMKRNKKGIDMFATNGKRAGYAGVKISDSYIHGFTYAISMKTENVGWINGNLFDNVSIRDFETAVIIDRSPDTLGIDYNVFKLYIQTGEYTKDIFIDPSSASTNNYNECTVWDMDTHHNARVGTGLLRNSMNGFTVQKERYTFFTNRKAYHLLGRFMAFDKPVFHVMVSITSQDNVKMEYLIRGSASNSVGVIERRNYGGDRLLDSFQFFTKDLPNGQKELYFYTEEPIEANIYFESMRSFYPSPLTRYPEVEGAEEITTIVDLSVRSDEAIKLPNSNDFSAMTNRADFPIGISYSVIRNEDSEGLPFEGPGTLITVNIVNSPPRFNYQEVVSYHTGRKFIRKGTGTTDSGWDETWIEFTQVSE